MGLVQLLLHPNDLHGLPEREAPDRCVVTSFWFTLDDHQNERIKIDMPTVAALASDEMWCIVTNNGTTAIDDIYD
jgi:hypothetical protein